jgi:protein-disulfide isomerase
MVVSEPGDPPAASRGEPGSASGRAESIADARRLLTINTGSSSLKAALYRLREDTTETPELRAEASRIGGRLLFVFRNFPLTRIHPHAQAAAEAAETAASQGRYWEMHDLLLDNQRHLQDEDLRRYAQQLGLDPERFDRELAQHAHARRVREDLRGGLKSGVRVTPTFFVNGLRHDGPNDLATLQAAVEEAAR